MRHIPILLISSNFILKYRYISVMDVCTRKLCVRISFVYLTLFPKQRNLYELLMGSYLLKHDVIHR
jgi:hypothetical protein